MALLARAAEARAEASALAEWLELAKRDEGRETEAVRRCAEGIQSECDAKIQLHLQLPTLISSNQRSGHHTPPSTDEETTLDIYASVHPPSPDAETPLDI